MEISTIFSSVWDNLTSVPHKKEVHCGKYRGSLGEFNCASYGDINSYCIYGFHCACGSGYFCEKPYDPRDPYDDSCAEGLCVSQVRNMISFVLQ